MSNQVEIWQQSVWKWHNMEIPTSHGFCWSGILLLKLELFPSVVSLLMIVSLIRGTPDPITFSLSDNQTSNIIIKRNLNMVHV